MPQSVNTIYKENNKVLGHNTDISGFELAMRGKNYDIKEKKYLFWELEELFLLLF